MAAAEAAAVAAAGLAAAARAAAEREAAAKRQMALDNDNFTWVRRDAEGKVRRFDSYATEAERAIAGAAAAAGFAGPGPRSRQLNSYFTSTQPLDQNLSRCQENLKQVQAQLKAIQDSVISNQ